MYIYHRLVLGKVISWGVASADKISKKMISFCTTYSTGNGSFAKLIVSLSASWFGMTWNQRFKDYLINKNRTCMPCVIDCFVALILPSRQPIEKLPSSWVSRRWKSHISHWHNHAIRGTCHGRRWRGMGRSTPRWWRGWLGNILHPHLILSLSFFKFSPWVSLSWHFWGLRPWYMGLERQHASGAHDPWHSWTCGTPHPTYTAFHALFVWDHPTGSVPH